MGPPSSNPRGTPSIGLLRREIFDGQNGIFGLESAVLRQGAEKSRHLGGFADRRP
jgi:hypothetical protein